MKAEVIEEIMAKVEDGEIMRDLIRGIMVAEEAYSALREILEAKLAPLTWTSVAPTEPGYYLIRSLTLRYDGKAKVWRTEAHWVNPNFPNSTIIFGIYEIKFKDMGKTDLQFSSRPIDMPEEK